MLDALSRADLVRVLELATRCLQVRTVADLEAVVSGIGDVVTFRKAALCAFEPGAGGPRIRHYVNHSYGAEWAAVYTQNRFETVDPVLGHGQRASGAFRWRDAMIVGAPDLGFLEAARDFGVGDGVSFGSPRSGPGPRTMLSLAELGPSDDRALAVLSALGPHVHEAYRRVLAGAAEEPAQKSGRALTPRELEILRWTQQGKTYWEIGCILGISERTVKFHFGRVKEKLDVVSASHAVARAMRLGILS
jgi:DNA-binding CsgD family transcriptional regulator